MDYQASFVDGIGSKVVFRNMFERAQGLLDGSLVVTLNEASAAVKRIAERNRVIVEGASALDALDRLLLPSAEHASTPNSTKMSTVPASHETAVAIAPRS